MATTSYVSRRSLLTAAASTMAGTAVAAAAPLARHANRAEPDPVFALIERHRIAAAEQQAASDARDEIEVRLNARRLDDLRRLLPEHPDLVAAVDRSALAIEGGG